jgi:hypothetical protein
LTELSINPPVPDAASGSYYVPYMAAADPANHVAISFQPISDNSQDVDGSTQLATYTVGTTGSLTTTSTRENMPVSSVKSVNYLKMSPSGKLLAVAGTAGLQVFHFNGASPITKYTGLLTNDGISQCFWDSNNHLYALSQSAKKLFVFTITPTSYSEAPGSPYTINGPQNIIVQPE